MNARLGQYDAILVASFGGPEAPDEVMPFLEHVVRGRPVPRERLATVAEHYYHFGGRSPINAANRALVAALRAELERAGLPSRVYLGNRHAAPFFEDALRAMQGDGVRDALVFVTSAFSSYSGCRQYRDALDAARAAIGVDAPRLSKLRGFFDHPLFLDAVTAHAEAALTGLSPSLRPATRLVFTAHSIPIAMAAASPYVEELRAASEVVARALGFDEHDLVFQSRSGPPGQPWLEPDVGDHLETLAQRGTRAVCVIPIGFVSDHMEVVWDLDHVAKERADALGLGFVRAQTAGVHPSFVAMVRELVEERARGAGRRALTALGPRPDVCPTTCCDYRPVRSSR